MKCGVITPIGPGHEELVKECGSSLSLAVNFSKGPFSQIVWYPIEDLEGQLGRSQARNEAVKIAREENCDWLFFLDADDLMGKEAFEIIRPYVDHYDGIWGAICELQNNTPVLRPNQIPEIHSYSELIHHDPFYTLQMGHFVRMQCVPVDPFDTEMNTGEDFKYYLNLWKSRKCIKIPVPLFINRRGLHSTGPKSATGQQWVHTVRSLILNAQAELTATKTAETSPSKKKDIGFDYKRFWENDNLKNIVPAGHGDEPEGWDPVFRLHHFILSLEIKFDSVIDFGCGYGRLSPAFSPLGYTGVDLNPKAIAIARQRNPQHTYQEIDVDTPLPPAELFFSYTVLLHLDDSILRERLMAVKRAGAKYILICEILGREWRRKGTPPVFNRDLEDYHQLLSEADYQYIGHAAYPYKRYADNPEFRTKNTDIYLIAYKLIHTD